MSCLYECDKTAHVRISNLTAYRRYSVPPVEGVLFYPIWALLPITTCTDNQDREPNAVIRIGHGIIVNPRQSLLDTIARWALEVSKHLRVEKSCQASADYKKWERSRGLRRPRVYRILKLRLSRSAWHCTVQPSIVALSSAITF